MEQSKQHPQINIGRDWNQAPGGSIKTDNRSHPEDSMWFRKMLANKALWIFGSIIIAAAIYYFGWWKAGGY